MEAAPTENAAAALQLDATGRRRMMTRAVVASAVGTAIEWYDFYLYGVAAALIFPQKFFPESDPVVGTLLAFSTFFVGFLARPIGAAIFGHYGDRIGRKASLIATLMLMGTATMAIGLIPGYDQIGIWGAVLLTLGRVMQGIGVGGEWGGSVLLAGEWTDPKRRGFTTSFAQWGSPVGLMLANGALALMTFTTSEASFFSWGWRVPFLSSIVLVFIGLYIRLGILETPVFARLKAQGRIARRPVSLVLRSNWREVLLTMFLRTGQQAPFYIFSTYVLTYGTQVLGFGRGLILNFLMISAAISLLTIPWFGHLSDVYGRRRVTALGCLLMVGWPFVYFALLDSRSTGLVFLAIVLALPIHDLQYAPQAAFISESFPGSLRYSGASLGYQLASLTAGGPAPILAVLLLQRFGTSMAVAAYMSACALVSLACVYALSEQAGKLDNQ